MLELLNQRLKHDIIKCPFTRGKASYTRSKIRNEKEDAEFFHIKEIIFKKNSELSSHDDLEHIEDLKVEEIEFHSYEIAYRGVFVKVELFFDYVNNPLQNDVSDTPIFHININLDTKKITYYITHPKVDE